MDLLHKDFKDNTLLIWTELKKCMQMHI